MYWTVNSLLRWLSITIMILQLLFCTRSVNKKTAYSSIQNLCKNTYYVWNTGFFLYWSLSQSSAHCWSKSFSERYYFLPSGYKILNRHVWMLSLYIFWSIQSYFSPHIFIVCCRIVNFSIVSYKRKCIRISLLLMTTFFFPLLL